MQYAGRLRVEDARGARFQIHEYRGRQLFRKVRRFVLETGEPVRRVDFDHHEVAKTGKRLVRIDSSI
jgi:hypothetical protein